MLASEVVRQVNILTIVGGQELNGVNAKKVIILQDNPIVDLPILIV